MAKSKKGKKGGQKKVAFPEAKLTLEALDAVSSDEDDGPSGDGELNSEAQALREAVAKGAFDKLLKMSKESSGDEFEEFDLDDSEAELEDDNEAEGSEQDDELQENDDDDEEEAGDDDNDDDDDEDDQQVEKAQTSSKALFAVYEKLRDCKKGMPFSETFCIIAETSLPFGVGGADGNPLDVHDDLKRELAFYNMSLEAANKARDLCAAAGVPFSRPDDFFAEMVKTDDHMAKVKDRLIFETKKMDAVAQRKVNKEQKLRAKEKHSNKLAEKAKRKKEHLKAVDDWAKTASQNRGSALRDNDDAYGLGKLNGKRGRGDQDGGPNKQRAYSNKKYGFGGKTGRFKQNTRESMDDMRSFNPKGNFGGGMKSKGGSGSRRKGKRARDAARSR